MSHDPTSPTVAIRTLPGGARQVSLESVDIEVVSGPDAGKRMSLCLPLVRLGTAPDNDMILSDRAVSRYHAEIRHTPDGLLFRDLDSTNGSVINGLRITEAWLSADSTCVVGQTHLQIRTRLEQHPVTTSTAHQLGQLVGGSAPMRKLYGLIQAIAKTPSTVLIRGESGAGKEAVARTLHALSGRPGKLVVFDAAVTDPGMIRSDLFGHLKGAFTGALSQRDGAFRQAQGGTLFIDEIGELPLELQSRLLRALENREVTPVGADQPLPIDVRVIAASHRDLAARVETGEFRQDLYYRLAVIPVDVPPLRDINEDIPLLAAHLCANQQLDCTLSADARAALQTYHWPGNVRELRNVLERAAALTQGDIITAAQLDLPPASGSGTGPKTDSRLDLLERETILAALARNTNNKAATARELGISLSTLKRRLKSYAS